MSSSLASDCGPAAEAAAGGTSEKGPSRRVAYRQADGPTRADGAHASARATARRRSWAPLSTETTCVDVGLSPTRVEGLFAEFKINML